jgi:CcmD family protein
MSDAFTPLYIAYSIAWIGVVAYLVTLHLKQKKLAAEVAALKEGGNG